MIIAFFTLLSLTVAAILFVRDRQYLKKSLKDVVSEDTKKFLNIRTKDATFEQKLKNIETKLSKKILDELNNKN